MLGMGNGMKCKKAQSLVIRIPAERFRFRCPSAFTAVYDSFPHTLSASKVQAFVIDVFVLPVTPPY